MQASFSELEYAAKKRVTRRDRFLAEIEAVTPWLSLTSVIAPHYPRAAIEEFANVFDVHATPTIVFADGEVVRGAPDDSASLAKLLAKIRSKVAQGIYFPNK